MGQTGTDNAGYHKKVANRRKTISTIRFLVNAKGLQLECSRVLHVTILMLVVMYGRDNDMEGGEV